MTDAPLYALRGVTKSYGGRTVLRVAQLDIRAGETLALVGPSGAGKSTLLRLLNFLEAPDSGTLTFNGRAYAAGDPVPIAARRQVTTVFQRPLLLHGTVRENVAYGLALRGLRGRSARAAVDEALAAVGMLHAAEQAARTLSGGESQRTALARALVIAPQALLLDEPTANLDPRSVAAVEAIIRTLNEAHRATLVLVTHHLFQARRLADRTAFMLDGAIVEVSPTTAFFEAPQDARTRAFCSGEMVY